MGCIPRAMKKNANTKTAPRNPVAIAMFARYSQTTTTMKDRRAPRGGSRNKQRDYREGNY